MRPELAEAVAWWESTDEAVTPFDDLEGNPYTIAEFDKARELEAQAQVEFDEAVDKDEQGDEFELATVFFALSLFFGGIATLIAKRAVTTALLIVWVVAIAAGSVILVRAF